MLMSEEYAKQGYLLEDFRLFHLRGTKGVRTEYHYHEFCKLLLLISGNGGYWVDGQRYDLLPGDVVLVDAGCIHRPEFEAGSAYERIIIYISPDFLKRSSSAGCDLRESFNGQRGHVLRPGKTASREIQTLAQTLERELGGEEYGRDILSGGVLLRLLVEIGRELRKGNAFLPGPVQPRSKRVAEIVHYIDEHLAEEISIDSLAERFFLSKFHMMRLFREGTGTSINTYLTQRRLMLARELIAKGMPATESCFRAGFGSYSAFTRAYGKFYGTTPTGRKYSEQLQTEGFE